MVKQICKIQGFENIRDIYYVNDSGDIYSFGNYGRGKSKHPRKLKQFTVYGYKYVLLMTNDHKTRDLRVHRIVASAFIPNPENLSFVNHIDENKSNNHISNLEWATPRGNNEWSQSKNVFMYDLDGNLIKVFASTYRAAEELKFNQGHIASVARGDERTHRGYIFSYSQLSKDDVSQRLSKSYYHKRGNRRK